MPWQLALLMTRGAYCGSITTTSAPVALSRVNPSCSSGAWGSSKANCQGMVSLIATTAKAEHVSVFHRFELMRRWRESESLPFETFVSSDGLHMNDWSFACLAKALGVAIAEAATRPTATAVGPHPAPAN